MFQNLNYKLHKRLSEVPPNQQSHKVYTAMHLRMMQCLIRLSTTVLCTYRAGVRKRCCGETVEASATILPVYRVGLRERRRGETV